MSKRIWPAATLAFIILALVPATAWASSLTRALDYFHAQQATTGGFGGTYGDPQLTPWVVMAISAADENPGRAIWKPNGKSPIDYLQSVDLANQATVGSVTNVPNFYAKIILAYVAAGRTDLIGSAGARRIDLPGMLDAYQNTDSTSADYGAFSPLGAKSTSAYAKINTTVWAILALHAAGETDGHIAAAVNWLEAQQASNGGFANQPGGTADVDDTAAAIMALRAAGVPRSATVLTDALAFIRSQQRADGGFPSYSFDPASNAESTAWAIQAGIAMGQSPKTWVKSGHNPVTFLTSLQPSPGNGAFQHRKGLSANPLLTTAEATVALAGKVYPFGLPSSPHALPYRPVFDSFTPAAGAKFTTSTVGVQATYHDNPKGGGTGINVKAVRVWLDKTNITSHVKIYSGSLAVTLTNVTNALHTLQIKLVDRAGNSTTVAHNFTVAAPVASSTTGTAGTGTGGTPSGTTPAGGHTLYPTPGTTPLPSATVTPGTSTTPPGTVTGSALNASGITGTPTPGVSPSTGQPLPTPSAVVSGQVTSTGKDGGGGGIPVEGYVGGGLVALLPLGALLSYVAQKHGLAALAEAAYGRVPPRSHGPLLRPKRHWYSVFRFLPFVRK